MSSIIDSLTWPKIVDLFHSATERIVIIMPAIHDEWVEVISENKRIEQLQLWICFDNDEHVFRSGYGDIDAINQLDSMTATIKQCSNLRLGFLVVDDEGWSLNFESRIISGNPLGPNAIRLDEQTVEKVLREFFPEKFNTVSTGIVRVEELSQEQLWDVSQKLDINKPSEPDMQRQISIYNTLFQYAELHFEGGNMSSKTVTIPSKALPFKDAELKNRLKTRLNLFTKEITDQWQELTEIKAVIEKIRNDYLVPCGLRKDKSILKKVKKADFQRAVDALKKLASENMQLLQNKLQSAIYEAKDRLRNELTIFFESNPPDSFHGLSEENRKRQLDKEISNIISLIKIPDASLLISKTKIEVLFYELTVEDLYDKEFINWFKEKELIDPQEEETLAKFSKAYQVKR